MRTEPFTYRGHTITPTTLKSRSGYSLYRITGPVTNENVAVGNERLRIDGNYKRLESAARCAAIDAKAAAS